MSLHNRIFTAMLQANDLCKVAHLPMQSASVPIRVPESFYMFTAMSVFSHAGVAGLLQATAVH